MSSMRQRELIAAHCGATDAFSLVIRLGYMLAKALFIHVTYKDMYYLNEIRVNIVADDAMFRNT